jgi:hypothetical protein
MDAISQADVREGATFKTLEGDRLTITGIRRAPLFVWVDFTITDSRGRTRTQKRKISNLLSWRGLHKD